MGERRFLNVGARRAAQNSAPSAVARCDGGEEGFLDKPNEFRAGRTLFEVGPRQGFRENSNFNFAASGA